MRAHIYALARWPGSRSLTPKAVHPALYREALECAEVCALVLAVSRAHAARLFREGRFAALGADGRPDTFGIIPTETR